jgi:hypothetical protein
MCCRSVEVVRTKILAIIFGAAAGLERVAAQSTVHGHYGAGDVGGQWRR